LINTNNDEVVDFFAQLDETDSKFIGMVDINPVEIAELEYVSCIK